MINLYSPSIIDLDKSLNFGNSLRKLKKSSKSCEIVVASPLFIFGKPFPSFDDLSLIVDSLNIASLENNIPIKLLTGAVFTCDCYLPDVIDTFFTIAKSRYLLIKLVGNILPSFLYDTISEFGRRGIVCICLGAELHPYLQKNPQEFAKLKSHGALFLINSTAICGKDGKRARDVAFELLENNTASFIGGSMIERAEKIALTHFGLEKSEKLFYTNPGKIIYNQNLF